MAQVAQRPVLQERIDGYLDYLRAEWEAIPAVAEEWETWDDVDRLHFDVDWPVREDRLLQLQNWAGEGLLTLPQLARYRGLLALIDRHRPILERLLAEWDSA